MNIRFLVLASLFPVCLAACQSARTVALNADNHADRVAGLPYALPYTMVKVELIQSSSAKTGATLEKTIATKAPTSPEGSKAKSDIVDKVETLTETKSGNTTRTVSSSVTESKKGDPRPKPPTTGGAKKAAPSVTDKYNFPAPKCGKPSYTVRVTPIHIADPYAPKMMLQMGLTSPFSNKKFALQTNEAGLLTSKLTRSSYGTLQAAANALSRDGLVVGDEESEETETAEDEAEDAQSEATAEGEESEDDAEEEADDSSSTANVSFEVEVPQMSTEAFFKRGGNSTTDGKVLQSILCTTVDSKGGAHVKRLTTDPGGKFGKCKIKIPHSKLTQQPGCSSDYKAKLAYSPAITVTLSALDWPPLPPEVIQKIDGEEKNLSTEAVQEVQQTNACGTLREIQTFGTGHSAICYRLFEVKPYNLKILETPAPGVDSKIKSREVGLFLTQADTSAVYDLKVVESILSANGMEAAFVDGQLVGLALDRPSPIVTTLTVPFELVGAIVSLPSLIAEAL